MIDEMYDAIAGAPHAMIETGAFLAPVAVPLGILAALGVGWLLTFLVGWGRER